ncbi:Ccr4-associated factor [Operophtera brumata]|uniref:Ccr4-associated factor n=1 Tax=Operophtera brumata TaxID=104452 RepID=A0A0L7LDX7_OPEBR|nr:Ccr4-associated factor [Operophtera brumata]
MAFFKIKEGGLQEVADQLELRRVRPQHQAGSDSHLTGMAFFKIKEGGLQEVADQLELRCVGPQHQAGSDSHLTGMAFFQDQRGWSAGGSGPAGAAPRRAAAPGRLRLASHRHGVLPRSKRYAYNLKGGLQEVADQLELRRVRPQHQAGSDSHLTGMAFFKINEIFFDDNIESSSGHLYGLGAPFPMPAASFGALLASVAKEECSIKNVWNHNLHEEFRVIRQVVKKFHWVAMDTEFPGVVARPIGEFRSTADYQYQLLRFHRSTAELRAAVQGARGTRHRTSGYLMKLCKNLKGGLQEVADQLELRRVGPQHQAGSDSHLTGMAFFKIKEGGLQEVADQLELRRVGPQHQAGSDSHLTGMAFFKIKEGGLQEVADQLELRRVGPQHQAGSDSHLTGMAFFKVKAYNLNSGLQKIFFDGNIESTSGHLYGLGAPFPTSANNFQENNENGNSS